MSEHVLKPCVTCRHLHHGGYTDSNWTCHRRGLTGNLVTGRVEPVKPLGCFIERLGGLFTIRRLFGIDYCGPEGKYWERKEVVVESPPPDAE